MAFVQRRINTITDNTNTFDTIPAGPNSSSLYDDYEVFESTLRQEYLNDGRMTSFNVQFSDDKRSRIVETVFASIDDAASWEVSRLAKYAELGVDAYKAITNYIAEYKISQQYLYYTD